jgi:ATP-binding cassette subfamily F protein 3
MLARMEPIAAEIEGAVFPIRFPEPDELSPPLMTVDGVSVGYDGRAVLTGVDLRLDQDDRIALLGANGQGKSTLAKLISGRLEPMMGRRRATPKLRIGYFAQHQADELVAGETPIHHIRRLRPDEPEGKLRARLAQGGIGAGVAETRVGNLSGGQKARLLLILATLDAPHLIILDEPTNHLDIESREALVAGLNEYGGAVILITHDAHLIELVADRLLLVRDGRVSPYDGDMESYRRLLLGPAAGTAERRERARAEKEGLATKPATRRVERAALAPLRAEVRACEARVEKIAAMLAEIDRRLANPAFYEGRAERIETLQKKRAEIVEAQKRAEDLWLAASARLEEAEAV